MFNKNKTRQSEDIVKSSMITRRVCWGTSSFLHPPGFSLPHLYPSFFLNQTPAEFPPFSHVESFFLDAASSHIRVIMWIEGKRVGLHPRHPPKSNCDISRKRLWNRNAYILLYAYAPFLFNTYSYFNIFASKISFPSSAGTYVGRQHVVWGWVCTPKFKKIKSCIP